jgi:hypothetical protein
MRRVYQGLGGFLLLLYSYAAFTGWEYPGNATKNVLPAGARNAGGYRSYHFWSGGK